MKKEELNKLLDMVCRDFKNTIITSIEENNKTDFPYTIACATFMTRLSEQNINTELSVIFTDTIIDEVYKEVSNFLAR